MFIESPHIQTKSEAIASAGEHSPRCMQPHLDIMRRSPIVSTFLQDFYHFAPPAVSSVLQDVSVLENSSACKVAYIYNFSLSLCNDRSWSSGKSTSLRCSDAWLTEIHNWQHHLACIQCEILSHCEREADSFALRPAFCILTGKDTRFIYISTSSSSLIGLGVAVRLVSR